MKQDSAPVVDPYASPMNPLSPQVIAKLEDVRQRLKGAVNARLIWERLLTRAERDQLGGDLDACLKEHKGIVGVWLALHNLWYYDAIIQLARRFGVLSEADYRWLDRELSPVNPLLSESKREAARPDVPEEDPEGRIEEASNRHKLVLVQGGRENHRLYWNGQWMRRPWSRAARSWDLMWQLAEKGKKKLEVSWDMFTPRKVRTLVSRRWRLKEWIPEELNELIVSTGHGRYQLDLEPSDIHLITLSDAEWLIEPDDGRAEVFEKGQRVMGRPAPSELAELIGRLSECS